MIIDNNSILLVEVPVSRICGLISIMNSTAFRLQRYVMGHAIAFTQRDNVQSIITPRITRLYGTLTSRNKY